MSLDRPVRWSLVAALALHTAAVLSVWWRWEPGLRGGLLVWIDFPSSLLFLGASRGSLLAWSLLLGGLQWALLGALLGTAVGRLARGGKAGPRRP